MDRLLRPVLDSANQDSGELLKTLRTFLEQSRSWQRTAEVLHIHRQPVLYRIRKVEQMTRLPAITLNCMPRPAHWPLIGGSRSQPKTAPGETDEAHAREVRCNPR